MFEAILKIIPKLDEKDLRQLQRSLQDRFAKVAKSFGKGIVNIFKGGGLLGAALALIEKVLNPLKDVQEAMERTLKTSDDIATNAGQFNTETGKLFKLVKLAQSTGLDQDSLFTLITKFQTAVAQAKADPNDQSVSSVRAFTGQTDTAEAFFNFIQSLQSMKKDQQVLVQQQVFGEKQILKMSDFLQTDFRKQLSAIGLDKKSSSEFTKSIEGTAKLNDLADVLLAQRESDDILKKGKLINENMIMARHRSEQIALERENKQLASYENLASISDMTSKIMAMVEQGIGMLGGLINKITPFVNQMTDAINKFMKSPIMKMKSWWGSKDE